MQNLELILLDKNHGEPFYQQIAKSLLFNIKSGNFKIDTKLPAINKLSEFLDVSRDTVEKAYNYLKVSRAISSVKGKGFYVVHNEHHNKVKILFLIGELNPYKTKTYNAFVDSLGCNSDVDLVIYNGDVDLFYETLKKHHLNYDYFVIMPYFKLDKNTYNEITQKAIKSISLIEEERLIFMENTTEPLSNQITTIYKDFENEVYNALKLGVDKICNYKKIVVVHPVFSLLPKSNKIIYGIRKFCSEYDIEFSVIKNIDKDISIKKRELFIIIEEADLVNFIKQTRDSKYVLGKDIGVISYHDTPLKNLFGISVLSTDYNAIGKIAAKIVLNKSQKKVNIPIEFIDRKSA